MTILILFIGCGKTSFIKALAGHLNFDICVLNLAEADLTDLALAKKLSQVPDKSILLLEDVDAAFASRSSSPNTNIDRQQISPRLDSGKSRIFQIYQNESRLQYKINNDGSLIFFFQV